MCSLNFLDPRRHLVSCSAQLNLISRTMLMRRMPFLCSIAVVLLAFSFAGCSGYSGGTVNGGGPVAPYINTQPANQTVSVGQTATFSVVAAGTPPLNYQWRKNSANINGAAAASYSTPATTTADSGSKFDVVVSNSAGSVTSAQATLTVSSGAVAPTITTQP